MPAPARLRRTAAFAATFCFLVSVSAKPILPAWVFGAPPRQIAAAAPTTDDQPLAEPQFDTTANPLPPNVPALGYHITGTSEFGDRVRLEGTAHFIDSVTVTLSSWAIRSDYPGSSALGYTHPITLKLHELDRRSGQPAAGALIAEVTTPFLIPWRPEPDPLAPPSPLRPWRADDGNFYGGLAFNITFDLARLELALPDELIFAVAFNTERHGAAPLGVEGPYNSLSVGLTTRAPLPGTDTAPAAVYWKTAQRTFYADGGGAGAEMLRLDSGWGAHTAAVRFNNSPYGSLAALATRLADVLAQHPAAGREWHEAHTLVTQALDRGLWQNRREPHLPWGATVFNLLATAADELAPAAERRHALAGSARQAVDSLLLVAQTVAESAVAETVVARGLAAGLVRAQLALDAAADARSIGQPATAIDELGAAWREAQISLR